jgi:hypothetical protein
VREIDGDRDQALDIGVKEFEAVAGAKLNPAIQTIDVIEVKD